MRGRRLCATCAIALSCLIKDAPIAAQQAFDQAYEGARTPRNASYDISVRLDPASNALRGIEIIRWRNISDEFTRELHLHVPPGATVTRLEARQPNGVLVSLPRGANGAWRLRVPWEIVPLETVELHVEWTEILRRAEDVAMIRWHPKMAVLEDRGWNTAPAHADFGSYDVQVTLPRTFEIRGTGFAAYWVENPDGSVTHRYRAEDVREFTWRARAMRGGGRPWLLVPLIQAAAYLGLAVAWRARRVS